LTSDLHTENGKKEYTGDEKRPMSAGFATVVKTENKDLSSRHKKYFYFTNSFYEPQHEKYKDPQELHENIGRNLIFLLNKALSFLQGKLL